jgi:hypothetical protein
VQLLDIITDAPKRNGYQEILLSLQGRLHIWAGEVRAFETGYNFSNGKPRGPSKEAQQVVRIVAELKVLLEEGQCFPI